MPGQARYGINKLRDAMAPIVKNGLRSVLIFGVPNKMGKVGKMHLIKSVYFKYHLWITVDTTLDLIYSSFFVYKFPLLY